MAFLIKHINSILLLLLMSWISCSSNQADNKHTSKPIREQEQIHIDTTNKNKVSPKLNTPHPSSILQLVHMIDSTNFKDSVALENEDFTEQLPDGGASLTGFFIKKKLVKIKLWVGLSYAIVERIFYFHQDNLVYVLETEDELDHEDHSSNKANRKNNYFEGHYFFNQQHLFQSDTSGHKLLLEERTIEKDFLESVIAYRKILLDTKQHQSN